MSIIRMSPDGSITMVMDDDGTFRIPSQDDMDTLEVGDDLSEEEIESLDD